MFLCLTAFIQLVICYILSFIKHSVSDNVFNIPYHSTIHCMFTIVKCVDFTLNCECQWISLSQPYWLLQIYLYPTKMSTTSATTALVARDCIPSDIADLSNFMCLFVLTSGTLSIASSILEEDIIEICVQLGHTHPEAVLWYCATKSVMLFHTADKLQIMVHGVMKALMLHEAIRIRTSPPSAAHVRAHMVMVSGEPSGTQPLPSNGEEEPQSHSGNPHPGGRTPQHFQANL